MATQQRWRVTFGKSQNTKYISHLDLHAAWERVFRRAGIPLAYSQGFNPQAKLHLAAALPVGYASRGEVMDVFLEASLPGDSFRVAIEPVLPTGLWLVAAEEVDLKGPSLQASLCRADYVVVIDDPVAPRPDISRRIADFLASTECWQTRLRKGKAETIDLRPLVFSLALQDEPTGPAAAVVLPMTLAAGQTANIRPETVLDALGMPSANPNIERIGLHFKFDSDRPHGYNNLS